MTNQADWVYSIMPEIKNEEELESIFRDVSNNTITSLLEEMKKSNKLRKLKAKSNLEVSESLMFNKYCQLIVDTYLDFLKEKLNKYFIINRSSSFFEEIGKNLVLDVWNISLKTLLDEMKNLDNEGSISGKDNKEKYKNFNTLFGKREQLNEFFSKNTELETTLSLVLEKKVNYIAEVISNTQKNWEELSRYFNISQNEKIEKLKIDSGDTHQNGKSVCIIKFTDGHKLVYKPRSMDIDSQFQTFLDILKAEQVDDFLTFRILSFPHYGWSEFIDFKECESKSEMKEYFFKIGEFLTILYMLNGNDTHQENIIAHGKYPMLIDLESLFAPRLSDSSELDCSLNYTLNYFKKSVNSIAILPTEITNPLNTENISLDLGGTSVSKNNKSPYKSISVKNMFTSDAQYFLENNIYVNESKNIPLLNDAEFKAYNYISDIKEGFEYMYLYFMNNKAILKQLLSSLFSNQKVRYINKSTMTYSKLLSMSSYPLFSKSPFYKKILFHRIGINALKNEKPLLEHEYNDLVNNDIPYFSAKLNEKNLYSSQNKVIKNILAKSPLEDCFLKIDNMSSEDLKEQLHFINMSFLNQRPASDDATNIFWSYENKYNQKIQKKDYLKSAKLLGNHLINQMCSKDENAYWIGPSIDGKNEDVWSPGILPLSLYDGNSGIAIFLAYLYYETKEEVYKDASLKAINPIYNYIKNLHKLKDTDIDLSMFTGTGGYYYALFKVAEYLNDSNLKSFSYKNLIKTRKYIKNAKNIDFISGLSGFIMMIINIYNDTKDEYYKRSLWNLIKDAEIEINKRINSDNTFNYSGFAHGISSIMAVYASIYNISNQAYYKNKVLEYMKMLEEFYNSYKKDWITQIGCEEISAGWCHGSPGILLALLICKKCGFDVPSRYLDIALINTLKKGIGNNITYCHGDIGSFEILEKYAYELKNDELKMHLKMKYDELFIKYFENLKEHEEIRNSHSFSLMIGVSGVGISLLNRISNKKTYALTLD
ncbi:type 2 lanthipeptide synthetase LanM family protein [Staphylococcus aureus]|uniref:type 2 lanthipeptide synthetase LanM family protein n=1 Tax=Staphylococcus aureus TaxID=1280 RepID=UPI0020295E25|nr:type 2 lanthipeptide synthetase LanM family protein [Staphylococcus aureus]MCL9701587.1 hypothetical protein [Staphylococcus aureus]UXT11119.1 type 2 lanthipeptide synthetase LanM family protein [Staphylococcus aureus]UXT19174.1 type 2 lanthipeptide synthetase LanM family protein [Staphylococcus aureus]UXT88215.1 type 2 lanthipeptide synthetase LanM family protein [Staphylococcus aureus]UXU11630.1 type 2 lanthipeptide synthetase LanM family protein [Staphylococcus aureus]